MAAEFQGQFMDAMKEAELDELRQEAARLRADAKAALSPLENFQSHLTEAVEAADAKPAAAAAPEAATVESGAHPVGAVEQAELPQAASVGAPISPAVDAAEPAPADPVPAETKPS
jgi:sec-independent protein translocase protein TatB